MYGYGYSLYNQVPFGRGGIDPDAQAFITAAAITNATQQAAIDTLVQSLKSNNIWTKMKAIYPFVTDNRNLLSYTEDFGNGVWVKNNGCSVTTNSAIAPNGTLTADTISFGADPLSRAQQFPFSIATYTYSVYLKTVTGTTTLSFGNWDDYNTITITSDWQRFIVTKTVTSNGVFTIRNNAAGNSGDVHIWGAQLELGSTATTYQPIATTQQAYISSQFKYNLKDPRDLDAAYRLVFNGGWTHSSTGATPNGTNGYADTFINLASNFTINSMGTSIYRRIRTTSGGSDIASFASNSSAYYNTTAASSTSTVVAFNISGTITYGDTSGVGLYTVNALSGITKGYRNGVSQLSYSTTGTIPNANSQLGKNTFGSIEYSNSQFAAVMYHSGLTDSEAANLYTIVQAFQTTLNRQV